MELAKNLFHMYIKQRKDDRTFKVVDALLMAAEDANVIVFELSKELEMDSWLKKDV